MSSTETRSAGQFTENITVKGCEASNGNGLGFHPGTGWDRSTVESCISHHNKGDGIFLCWRVQNGVFKNNVVYANQDNGISIGHKDTDNVFENNHVYEMRTRVYTFRDETEENSGHRNTLPAIPLKTTGCQEKPADFISAVETRDITITNNIIRSTGKGNQTSVHREEIIRNN